MNNWNLIVKIFFLSALSFFSLSYLNASYTVNNLKKEQKFVQVENVQISYREIGKENIQNGVVVFLHGFFGSSSDWEFVIQECSKFYYCIAVDIPPFGLSEKPLSLDYSNKNTVALLTKFIDKLSENSSINKFVLAGHSMGGFLSIKLTNLFPEKIEKLILINAAYDIPTSEIFETSEGIASIEYSRRISLSQLNANALSRVLDVGLKIYPLVKLIYTSSLAPSDILSTQHFDKLFSQNFFLPGEVLVKLSLDKLNEAQNNVKNQENRDSISELKKIKVPTLIVYGEKDNITPPQIGVFLSKNIENSEFILIPNESHMPLANKYLISKIVDFLKNKN